jgi:uncharacterized membrane protein
MDDLIFARALHVVAVLAWMGGVWFVTLVVLPAIAATTPPDRQIAEFHRIEGRFAPQAMAWVLLTGASGFWMTWRMELWWRFVDPAYWWMWAMLLVWLAFMLILFVAEPLIIHPLLKRGDGFITLARMRILHVVLSLGGLIATAGAVAGAHGWVP